MVLLSYRDMDSNSQKSSRSHDSHQISAHIKTLIPYQLEACYRMKPLILFTAMTVIGLFGIIGTVEYTEAKTYTHNIFGDCKNEIIHLHENDILQIHNNDPRITPNESYYWNQYKKHKFNEL